jgi:hypothetical protein
MSCRMRPSPLTSSGLALALALAPVTARASLCREPAVDTTPQDRYADCFRTNREAPTTATRIEQMRVGRTLFQSEPRDVAWVTRDGDDIVQASTYDCPRLAAELPEPDARAMLGACIELLQLHLSLVPPEFPGAPEYRQRSEAAQRQLESLNPPAVPPPQPAHVLTKPPPQPAPPPLRGLHVGLGLGVGLGVVGIAVFVAGNVVAEKNRTDIPGVSSKDNCWDHPTLGTCPEYLRGLDLFIAGAVSIAAATAIMAVFGTRIVRARHRAPSNVTASAAPTRGGAAIGLRIQF